MTVKAHYDRHLGNFYSWMIGDFDQKQAEHQEIFTSLKILPRQNKIAIDLGAGHGIQSIALANLGFTVKAVDFNKQLTDELRAAKGELPIDVITEDIQAFFEQSPTMAEVIVCMGDTITHIDSISKLYSLFLEIYRNLLPGGKAVFSFRDLTVELVNEQRFIPVKSDECRILTCYLEYFTDHVMVHDILWEKGDNGWTQKVSAYPKLRLSEKMVSDKLKESGFTVIESKVLNRMNFIVAEKPY
jgi:SAM-dependent methyltransferase